MDPYYTDDPFGAVVDESSSQILMSDLRRLEAAYFGGIAPVVGIEVSDDLDPALLTATRVIRINKLAARWKKVRNVLILHELIHHALWELDGDPDNDEGERFQREVARLWDHGAYVGLL